MCLYSKVGSVYDAKQVFDKASERNVVMYNTMITGFLRSGMVEDSRWLFHSMREKDLISRTTMITGLTRYVLYSEAMDLFRLQRDEDRRLGYGSIYLWKHVDCFLRLRWPWKKVSRFMLL